MASPLAINLLLETAELSGGVKVTLHLANMMASRGHSTRVISKDPRPTWMPLDAEFRRVPAFEPAALPAGDVTVATYWTTIAAAAGAPTRAAVHYCQGFEGAFDHTKPDHDAILKAYGVEMPRMAVSPHLAAFLGERFGHAVRIVPPALEPWWRPRWRAGPRRQPRVIVMHPFEFYMKGVPLALEAVRLIRAAGLQCKLIRVSQWPLGEAEAGIVAPDEFHCLLPPRAVARVMRGADLLLAPSSELEGFGLPVLEAMACGVPVVASDIASFRALAGDAAILARPGSATGFCEAALAILRDPSRWRRLRRRGVETARRYTETRVAAIAEDALRWVVDGRWRAERGEPR